MIELLSSIVTALIFALGGAIGYLWGRHDAINDFKFWFKTGNTTKLIDVLGGDYWRITKL